jgi:hypothetical protein
MVPAIDALPADEREAFDLVRIQGMTQAEAAQVLGGDGEATVPLPEVRCRWQQMYAIRADLPEPSSPRILRGGCPGVVTPQGYPL